MYRIVFVRHGECEFNLDNKFSGWYDANLTEKGIKEAKKVGRMIAKFEFDEAYTSVLQRSKYSLSIILDEIGQSSITKFHNWRLNERHYSALTGFNRDELGNKYGKQQVKEWLRYIVPPAMKLSHPYYDIIVNDPRYEHVAVPTGETITMAVDRIRPYWQHFIASRVKSGRKVLIVGHGSTLGCFNMIFNQGFKMPPTGVPYYYDFDENMNPTGPMVFVWDDKKQIAKMKKKNGN